MKPIERLDAVFSFEKPDRVPIFDKFRNEKAIAYYAGEPFVPERGRDIAIKAWRATLDCTGVFNYPQAERVESTPDGFVRQHLRWTTWLVGRPFTDVTGLAAWVRREIERLDGFDPHEGDWLAARMQRLGEIQAQLGDTVYLFDLAKVGLDKAHNDAGLELFSYLMRDEPALLSRWLDATFRANLRILAAIDPGRLPTRYAIFGEDIAGKSGTLFAPAFLRREFFPRLRELVGAYHALGMKVIFHSDGNLNRVMDDLVATGIDALHPLEVQAGMELATLKAKYGQRLVLVGGMDASQLLPNGTPDEVRKATQEALRVGTPGSGYILGSTTELSNAIPLENIIAMWETARGFRYT